MTRGANIPVTADATGVIREARKIRGALEDVEGSLDDVSTQGRDTDKAVSTALDSIADQGDTTADRLERTFRESFDAVKKEAKTQGKAIGDTLTDGVKDGADTEPLSARDVFKADLAAELTANMTEAGAEMARGLKDGFDTEDLTTLLDGVSDTIVAVGAMGGPVGAAAGLAASSAMQLLIGPVIADAQARAAEFEQTFTTAFGNIVSAGQEMGRELTIQGTVSELVQDTGKLDEVTRTANLLGIERGVVLRAMAGDTEALTQVQDAKARSDRELAASSEEITRKTQAGIKVTGEEYENKARLTSINRDVTQGLHDVNGEYANHTKALDAAADAAKAKGEADNYAAEKAIRYAQKTAAATGKSQTFEATIDGVTQKIKVMPSGKVVKVTDNGTAEMTQREIDDISGSTVTVPVEVDLPTKAEIERQWSTLLGTLNIKPLPVTIAAPKPRGVPYP